MSARSLWGVKTAVLLAALAVAAPAWAQQAQEEAPPQEGPMYQEPETEEIFAPGYEWSASLFGGNMSGGTPVGSVQNLFFITTFETGSDAVWGFRGARRVWWRLSGEAEFVRGSPGVQAILTSLDGEQRTELEFAPLDVSYLSGSVRFDLADTWIMPFLAAGVAVVRASGEELDDTAFGIVFGGGAEVALPFEERVFVRADVRGLRSGITEVDLQGDVGQDTLATQVIWTLGVGVRF